MGNQPSAARMKKLMGGNKIEPVAIETPTADITTLNVTGVQTHTNASGAYVNGPNAVCKQVDFAPSSANIDSGAIYIPGNSIITKLTVVCVDAAGCDSGGNITLQAGTTVGATDYAAAVVFETGTSVNGGVGTSTDTAMATALTADNPLVQQANTSLWCDGAAEVHLRVIHAGGPWTGGSFAFIVEFVYAGGN
jgi:hypothetical protein